MIRSVIRWLRPTAQEPIDIENQGNKARGHEGTCNLLWVSSECIGVGRSESRKRYLRSRVPACPRALVPSLFYSVLTATVLFLAACSTTSPPTTTLQPPTDTATVELDAGLARISEWFAGDFDNYAQVLTGREAKSAFVHERIHLSFVPVEVPAIGGSVFFARQSLDDDPRPIRLRLYRFAMEGERIRLDQYRFNDAAPWRGALDAQRLRELSRSALSVAPDCAVYFSYDPARERFIGATEAGKCRVASERFEDGVVVEDRIEIARDEVLVASSARDASGKLIYGHPQGVPHRHRKAQWFGGLVVVNQAGRNARPDQRDWHTLKDVRVHNEGGWLPLVGGDGRRLGVSLRLARVRFGDDPDPALVLYVLDDATGQSISYALADATSKRIGINLKWVQVQLQL